LTWYGVLIIYELFMENKTFERILKKIWEKKYEKKDQTLSFLTKKILLY